MPSYQFLLPVALAPSSSVPYHAEQTHGGSLWSGIDSASGRGEQGILEREGIQKESKREGEELK